MEPCYQSNRIEKIEGTTESIEDKLDGIVRSQDAMAKDINNVMKMVEAHEITLMGRNGDVGLVSEVRSLQSSVESLVRTTVNLVTALQGEKGNAGLVGVITSMQKTVSELADAQKWFIRLVLGIIVAAILGLVVVK